MRAGPHLQPLQYAHIIQALESSTGLQGTVEPDATEMLPSMIMWTPYMNSYACDMHVTSTYMHVDPNMPVT